MKRNSIFEKVLQGKRGGLIASCAFSLGFISVTAQVILIRELMSTFSGHELVFAVVLGVWLLGVALGSALMRLKGAGWAAGLMVVALALIPATVVGVRLLKRFLDIPLGSVADIGLVALSSAALLLPLAVILGAMFSTLVTAGDDGSAVYGQEALGFVAGGVLMTFIFFVPLPHRVDAWSRRLAWPEYRVLAAQETRYGSLVVAERGGQKSFFENGRHLFTAQDALSAEDVHAGLLLHPAPRRVFLIGGGFAEAGQELLKHPLERLDYAQLDPQAVLLEYQQFMPKADPRLHVFTSDPRQALARSLQAYDVIVVNTGDPTSLLTGRFFTRDFFAEARRHMGAGGIFALTISSAENYVNAQGKAYARGVRSTLLSVFNDVQVIPGERMTFMASDVHYPLDRAVFAARLKGRGIRTKFMQEYYLADRMDPARLAAAAAWLAVPGEISTDERPAAGREALIFTTTRSGPGFARFMHAAQDLSWLVWVLVPGACSFIYFRRKQEIPLAGAGIAGFTQMSLQIAVILAVQSFFGYAYAVVGLLTAGFMLGVAGGVRIGRSLAFERAGRFGAWMQAALAIFFVGTMAVWPSGLFILPVMAGVAGGIQFAAYSAMAGEKASGRIYAADVLGAAAGALLTGMFFVPLWGISMTMVFVATLNLAAGMMLQPKSVSADL